MKPHCLTAYLPSENQQHLAGMMFDDDSGLLSQLITVLQKVTSTMGLSLRAFVDALAILIFALTKLELHLYEADWTSARDGSHSSIQLNKACMQVPLSKQSQRFPYYLYEQVQAACCGQVLGIPFMPSHVRRTLCAVCNLLASHHLATSLGAELLLKDELSLKVRDGYKLLVP